MYANEPRGCGSIPGNCNGESVSFIFLLLFLHSAAEVSIFTVVFFVCLVLLISIPSGWCSSMQISSGYRSQLLEIERASWCHFEFQIESAEFLKSRIGLNIS